MQFSKKPNENPALEHVMSEGSILGIQKSKQWLGFGTGAKGYFFLIVSKQKTNCSVVDSKKYF